MSEQEAKQKMEELLKNYSKALKEPFHKFVEKKLMEIAMSPDHQEEFDELNSTLKIFKKVRYPETAFKDREKDIEELINDADFKRNIQGIDYFSEEINQNNEAFGEIKRLCIDSYDIMKNKYDLE